MSKPSPEQQATMEKECSQRFIKCKACCTVFTHPVKEKPKSLEEKFIQYLVNKPKNSNYEWDSSELVKIAKDHFSK
mgnify:CR=1 FL=1